MCHELAKNLQKGTMTGRHIPIEQADGLARRADTEPHPEPSRHVFNLYES